MNYFELFDIPVKILFDRSQLAKKYFELQKQFHPDFYTQADEWQREDMLERSSQINRALKTLQSEDRTIQYILEQNEMLPPDEKYQLPSDFLMEMMELNEANPLDAGAIARSALNQLREEIAPTLQSFDATGGTPQALQTIKSYYFKKKYLQRILDRLAD